MEEKYKRYKHDFDVFNGWWYGEIFLLNNIYRLGVFFCKYLKKFKAVEHIITKIL